MKGILTTAMIVFATLTINAQTMGKGYWNHLTQNENPKHNKPKPESIKFKGNKVIVVWNRREYGTSITQMTGIYSVCIHEMKLKEALRERFPECRYYDTEQDIFNALELKYEPSDLKGWELEQFNKR